MGKDWEEMLKNETPNAKRKRQEEDKQLTDAKIQEWISTPAREKRRREFYEAEAQKNYVSPLPVEEKKSTV